MKRRGHFIIPVAFGLALLMFSCKTGNNEHSREFINLGGEWQFSINKEEPGSINKLLNKPFDEKITLPGTLCENKKGLKNTDTTDLHLNREYMWHGPAWFKKTVDIPDSWTGSQVKLIMERTKVTRVWFDSIYIGTNNTLFTQQEYDLSDYITPGSHTLTIMVDNTLELVPVAGSHACEEHTQTNWNGIIGRLGLEKRNPVNLRKISIYPDPENKQINVHVNIINPAFELKEAKLFINAKLWNHDDRQSVPEEEYSISLSGSYADVDLVYDMGDDIHLWNEFEPALYRLNIRLHDNDNRLLDETSVNFGMRNFGTSGTRFTINEHTTFLRGKQDAAVFPLTGYPPMDTAGWGRVFRIAKSYGINHYRFHSWTPPGAAFLAADKAGLYLQPELPIWWGFNANDPEQVKFMMNEGRNIMDHYGNYASFAMFALGNEIFQDRTILKKMVDSLRNYDNRHLYAQGSNNWLSDPYQAKGDDYWTSFRTGTGKPDFSTDVRGSMSFHDSHNGEGGIINSLYPSLNRDYSKAIENSTIPVIGHEIGQYQIYPDYNEMKKYTGVLKPWNFDVFRQKLKDKNMLALADDFHKSSGALAVICYQAEIEMAIRTPGFGGFQLLDLQDFPGQGTALVGILDAFMESKGLISKQEFRGFCNEVVVLLVSDKYCWENNEKYTAEIRVANYGPAGLNRTNVNWTVITEDGNKIGSGSTESRDIPQGEVTTLGKITLDLNSVQTASKAFVRLSMNESNSKEYPLWIYPSEDIPVIPENIIVTEVLNSRIQSELEKGRNVLFFPDLTSTTENTVAGMFIPDFWNYAMFKSIAEQYNSKVSPGTLGLLMDSLHHVFNNFPTEYHSNWQWWSIVKNSRPLILDRLDAGYLPIVQVIDNINRNHKLGLIFEFKAGKGNLLVCMSALPSLTDRPAARQLYKSLINYMQSGNFDPYHSVSFEELDKLFH